jgi:caspase domain-containing protein
MRYALIIGINIYQSSNLPQLNGAINDASDFRSFLAKTGPIQDVVPPLLGGQAKAADIRAALARGIGSLAASDVLTIFFAGHGGKFFTGTTRHDGMCPVDFDGTRDKVILDIDLRDAMSALQPGARVTIIADCCYSGGLDTNYQFLKGLSESQHSRFVPQAVIMDLMKFPTTTFNFIVDDAAERNDVNVVLLSACGLDREAFEGDFPDPGVGGRRKNGALTHFLLQELGQPHHIELSATDTCRAVDRALAQQFDQHPELHGRRALFSLPLITR